MLVAQSAAPLRCPLTDSGFVGLLSRLKSFGIKFVAIAQLKDLPSNVDHYHGPKFDVTRWIACLVECIMASRLARAVVSLK